MSATGFQRRRRMVADVQAAGTVLIDEAGHSKDVHAGNLEKDIAAGGNAVKTLEKSESTGPSLAELTVKELRELAKDKGIALGGELTKKADIVAAVGKALGES